MSPLAPFLRYAASLPARTYYSFLAFVLAVYLALIGFQTAIVTFVIPQDFTLHYLLLDVNNPNVSSMFFCNFMHNPLSVTHMTDNVATFVFLIVLVFVAGFILLPASGFPLPKHFFPAMLLVYLAGLPFALSGMAIWTGRIVQKTYVSGFSGFNFALLGLFFFLLLVWLYSMTLRERHGNPVSPYALLFATFFMVVVATGMIFLDLANPAVGIYVHLGGFLLGLLLPAIVGMVLVRKEVGRG